MNISIWETPAIPEIAALAPEEREVPKTCKIPLTSIIRTIKGSAME